MFAILKNQFKLTFELNIDSPLCIRDGEESIDPTLPDMQCIRTYKNEEKTVFIPGSSIKGVVRSRCEKIFNIIAQRQVCCNIVDKVARCPEKNKDMKYEEAKDTYKRICAGCRMFGSLALGGRIKFKDAYPIGKCKTGIRNGVGINRITGAAQSGALYEFEVIEDGKFEVVIVGENYELYQLKSLLWVLEDINEGYVTFGSAGTRGNGKMLVDNVRIEFRDFRNLDEHLLTGYFEQDQGGALAYENKRYYYSTQINGIKEIMKILESVDVSMALSSIRIRTQRGEDYGDKFRK